MCRYTTKRLRLGRSILLEKVFEPNWHQQLITLVASISRLETEFKYTNAEINVMYAPYTILKETGKI